MELIAVVTSIWGIGFLIVAVLGGIVSEFRRFNDRESRKESK